MAESDTTNVEVASGTVTATNASFVTTEFLEDTFQKAENNTNIFVSDFSVEPACGEGENYATEVVRVRVKINNGAETQNRSIVLKLPYNGEEIKAMFIKSGIFKKEMMFYRDVIPTLTKVQRDLNVEPLPLAAPRFYSGLSDEEKMIAYIAVEDLEGYRMADVRKGLDVHHCKLIVKELARLHALSLVLKNKDPVLFRQYCDTIFQESHFSLSLRPVIAPMFSDGCKRSVGWLCDGSDGEEFESKVQSLLSVDPVETILECVKPSEPFAVFCHGDAWANNAMFKYKEDDANTPVAVKFVDFQMVRYALPVSDLSYFLFMSTSRSMRKAHLQEILKVYVSAFNNVLHHCKFSFPEFTYDAVLEMFKQTAMYGFLCSCASLPPIFGRVAADKSENLKKIEDALDLIETMYSNMSSNAAVMEALKKRLHGNVEEVINLGL